MSSLAVRLVRFFWDPGAADRVQRVIMDWSPAALSSAEIGAAAEVSANHLYPALRRLENAGIIDSRFQGWAYPRRRVYSLAEWV